MASTVLLRKGMVRQGRGATRKDTAVRGSSLARKLVPLIFLLLLIMAADLGVNAFRDVATAPIREVSVNGDFRYLDTRTVEQLITPYVGIGYFLVDLQAIREELESLPLVHEVTVRRGWPDRLLVFITEQVPMLRYGDDAYLNPYAEVFRPQSQLQSTLPRVDGPGGSETKLRDTFLRFSELLEPTGLSIVELELDGKHAWRVQLDSGTEVLLGRREVDARFKTLVALIKDPLADETGQLARIDMRYSNGFSVLRHPEGGELANVDGAVSTHISRIN